MKKCFKCEIEKPLAEFYAHKQMADGHLNKCKDCAKRDVRTDRKNSENAREYDRRRSRLPHRVSQRKKTTERWTENHPERYRANNILNAAVRDKKVFKEPCYFCNAEKVEGHHHRYDEPLNVTWLCVSCHRRLHALANTNRISMPHLEES